MIKVTNNIFIEKSKKVHGNKYDYSLVDYKNAISKIKIICLIHGIFEQKPNNHLNKQGCPKCYYSLITSNNDAFIKKAKFIHKDKYDYSEVKYVGAYINVKIKCSIHGIFEQTPHNHIHGTGCPKCAKNLKLNTNDFIKKAKFVHGNKYDYSEVKYVGNKEKIKIKCPIHGIFEQTPNNHLNNQGCSKCKQSKGENKIEEFLLKNNIKYYNQKTFNDCKHKRKLEFDFYLPEYNMCIEYDGKQHFEPIEYFGGDVILETQKKIDKIKNEYCKNNDINIIRIKYNENIEDNLKSLEKNILEIV